MSFDLKLDSAETVLVRCPEKINRLSWVVGHHWLQTKKAAVALDVIEWSRKKIKIDRIRLDLIRSSNNN